MSNPALDYSIGSAVNSVQSFYDLGIIAPFQDPYAPFGVEVDAADSLVYGHGYPFTAWRWGYISQEERDLLKTYCAGKSAIVYVRLHDDDWSLVYCRAVMIWQAESPPSNGFIQSFSILLRILDNYGASLP